MSQKQKHENQIKNLLKSYVNSYDSTTRTQLINLCQGYKIQYGEQDLHKNCGIIFDGKTFNKVYFYLRKFN